MLFHGVYRPGKPGEPGKLREFDKTPGNHGKVREIGNYTWNFMLGNELVNLSLQQNI